MAMSLKLSNLAATVTNVKSNTDKNEEGEKDVRTHIDFKAEIDAELMDQLSLGDPFSFKDVFFTKEGDVKNVGIKTMDIDRKYDDHRLTIQHDRLSGPEELVLDADIHQLKLTPMHGHRFMLGFRAATNPGINNMAFIAESQIIDCIVFVEPVQLDLEDSEGEEG